MQRHIWPPAKAARADREGCRAVANASPRRRDLNCPCDRETNTPSPRTRSSSSAARITERLRPIIGTRSSGGSSASRLGSATGPSAEPYGEDVTRDSSSRPGGEVALLPEAPRRAQPVKLRQTSPFASFSIPGPTGPFSRRARRRAEARGPGARGYGGLGCAPGYQFRARPEAALLVARVLLISGTSRAAEGAADGRFERPERRLADGTTSLRAVRRARL